MEVAAEVPVLTPKTSALWWWRRRVPLSEPDGTNITTTAGGSGVDAGRVVIDYFV